MLDSEPEIGNQMFIGQTSWEVDPPFRPPTTRQRMGITHLQRRRGAYGINNSTMVLLAHLFSVSKFHQSNGHFELNSESRTRVMKKKLSVFISFFYALKAKLHVLKSDFRQIKLW